MIGAWSRGDGILLVLLLCCRSIHFFLLRLGLEICGGGRSVCDQMSVEDASPSVVVERMCHFHFRWGENRSVERKRKSVLDRMLRGGCGWVIGVFDCGRGRVRNHDVVVEEGWERSSIVRCLGLLLAC